MLSMLLALAGQVKRQLTGHHSHHQKIASHIA